MHSSQSKASHPHITFLGGGNMASAIIGGLRKRDWPLEAITVIEPFDAAREALRAAHGLAAMGQVEASVRHTDLVVWAVKPQSFVDAAKGLGEQTKNALHVSVMAGIPASAITTSTGSQRVVRCMPNTPALVGQGMSGLFAAAPVTQTDRSLVQTIMAGTGDILWVELEDQLDAVTALSGSGPAYVFYFLEAMQQAGTELGLSAQQARKLAVQTFLGSSVLARDSVESLTTLRERVTSKGGTTHAAVSHMEASCVGEHFVNAMHAASARAKALGLHYGH
jgi:pyrroline-5-carboxylate reductase